MPSRRKWRKRANVVTVLPLPEAGAAMISPVGGGEVDSDMLLLYGVALPGDTLLPNLCQE